MKNAFLIILMISTLKIVGQKHLIGFKVGINKTNIASNNLLNQYDYITGPIAGLTYEYLFKKHFSIGADLMYNQRGFSYDFILIGNIGNPIGEKYRTTYILKYISLPIKTGFNIGTKLYGFTNIGVIPSILVGAKRGSRSFDPDVMIIGNKTYDVTNQFSKFDFAGLVEIGGGYKFNKRYWLFTSFSYQHSFTNLANTNYFSNSKLTNYGMTIILGMKWSLTKE